LVCVTGPSSPGLRTLIDTLMFAGMFAGPGCGAPDPRSSMVSAAVEVACALGSAGASPHVQFQIQFHVQSGVVWVPDSDDVDATLPSQTLSVQFHTHEGSSGDISLD
jgi:hypothetical protein